MTYTHIQLVKLDLSLAVPLWARGDCSSQLWEELALVGAENTDQYFLLKIPGDGSDVVSMLGGVVQATSGILWSSIN